MAERLRSLTGAPFITAGGEESSDLSIVHWRLKVSKRENLAPIIYRQEIAFLTSGLESSTLGSTIRFLDRCLEGSFYLLSFLPSRAPQEQEVES